MLFQFATDLYIKAVNIMGREHSEENSAQVSAIVDCLNVVNDTLQKFPIPIEQDLNRLLVSLGFRLDSYSKFNPSQPDQEMFRHLCSQAQNLIHIFNQKEPFVISGNLCQAIETQFRDNRLPILTVIPPRFTTDIVMKHDVFRLNNEGNTTVSTKQFSSNNIFMFEFGAIEMELRYLGYKLRDTSIKSSDWVACEFDSKSFPVCKRLFPSKPKSDIVEDIEYRRQGQRMLCSYASVFMKSGIELDDT